MIPKATCVRAAYCPQPDLIHDVITALSNTHDIWQLLHNVVGLNYSTVLFGNCQNLDKKFIGVCADRLISKPSIQLSLKHSLLRVWAVVDK